MRSLTFRDITWHDDANPSEKELRVLQKQYGFHDLDIEDCLSKHERPKIEEYESYLFIVFHIPYGTESSRIAKEELNIFLGQNFIVTLHRGRLLTLDALMSEMLGNEAMREECLRDGPGAFLYQLMSRFFDGIFPLVDDITREIRRIEEELFETDEESDLLKDIMTVKRNIINARAILLPQRTILATLEHKNRKFVPEELSLYFDDILDAIERQWSLLDTAKEMIDALQDTHEAWLGHRTNEIIRVLTMISVVILPLTFVTGLYGMNVVLPFESHPLAFFIVVGIMCVITGAMIAFFAKRRWL